MCDGKEVELASSLAQCLFANSSSKTSKECSCNVLCIGTNKWVYNSQKDTCYARDINTSPCSPSYYNNTFNSILQSDYVGWYCNSSVNHIFERHCIPSSSPDLCSQFSNSEYGTDPVALGVIVALSAVVILLSMYFCYQTQQATNGNKSISQSRSSSSGSNPQGNQLRPNRSSNIDSTRRGITNINSSNTNSNSNGRLIQVNNKNDTLPSSPKKNLFERIGLQSQKKKKNKNALPMRKLSSWFRMNAELPRPKEAENSIPEPEVLNVSTKFRSSMLRQTSSLSASNKFDGDELEEESRKDKGNTSNLENISLVPSSMSKDEERRLEEKIESDWSTIDVTKGTDNASSKIHEDPKAGVDVSDGSNKEPESTQSKNHELQR